MYHPAGMKKHGFAYAFVGRPPTRQPVNLYVPSQAQKQSTASPDISRKSTLNRLELSRVEVEDRDQHSAALPLLDPIIRVLNLRFEVGPLWLPMQD
jgi:hypothetical protein